MLRLLFEKNGKAVWISHLDLMRVFQRAFQRAGLPLTHTNGYNPRPKVSIALPMSVGISSRCELLDFSLDGIQSDFSEIQQRLNASLISGVKILKVYENGEKLKNLAWLSCKLVMEYDNGVPEHAADAISSLFLRSRLLVEKRGKNGVAEQDIISMISSFEVLRTDENTLVISLRVHCQEPALNPMQILSAVQYYLPEYIPNFCSCCREEIYTEDGKIFR